jgi:quinol monooxygenase YgiN
MPAFGFLVEMEAQPGREDAVATFLAEAKVLVDDEPGTLAWFAFRVGPTTFKIFDAFETEDDRQTHLHGKVRERFYAQWEQLFTVPPVVNAVDILETKLPN